MSMSTWILIWVITVSGFDGYQGNAPVSVATGSVVFHSQKSCEDAVAKLSALKKKAYCFEDVPAK